MAMPTLLAAALLVFMRSFADFGIISGAILSWVTMISELSTAIILYTGKTKTLTVAIYTEVIRGNYGTAAALSTIMTILTVISLLAFSKLNGGKDISL